MSAKTKIEKILTSLFFYIIFILIFYFLVPTQSIIDGLADGERRYRADGQRRYS